MSGFFSYDSKFTQVMNKIVDIVVLSFFWVLLCLPVVTAGASSTALFTTVRQVLRGNRGYVIRNFFRAFKSNFKQSTGIWLLLLLLFVVFFLDRWILRTYFAAQGSPLGSLSIVFTFLIIYELVWGIYIFAYISRFELDWKHILKNAAILSVTNLPWSVLMGAMLLGSFALVFYVSPMFAFVLPAACGWIFTIILEKIFRRYMTKEDLEKVQEEERLDQENGR